MSTPAAQDLGYTYGFEKIGKVIDSPNECYFPSLVDYRDVSWFPFDFAIYTSTDHGAGGIYLYCCNGDPRESSNWMTYDAALAAGWFDGVRGAPASNPIYTNTEGNSDTESPCVNIVGNQVYLTMHNSGFTKGGDNLQLTLLAISDDGITFTDYDNGSGSAVILNADGDDELHTGYFKWAANPFRNVSYDYIGYALKRGGDQSCMCMWGSNDAKTWVEISHLHHNRYGMGFTDGLQLNLINIDIKNIRRMSGDIYYTLCDVSDGTAGAGVGSRQLYGIYLEGDGYTVNRIARLELDNGAASSYDEAECTSPCTLSYNGSDLLFYQSKSALDVNTVSVAEGDLATEVKPGRRYPHILSGYHVSNSYDFTSLSSFPDFLNDASYSGGSWTFTSSGIKSAGTGGSSWAAVQVGPAITADNYEMIELVLDGAYSEAATRSTELVRVDFSDSISSPTDEIFIQAYAAPYYELQGIVKVATSTVQTVDTDKKWFNGANNTIGLRWYPKRDICQLIGHGNTVIGEFTPDATLDTSGAYIPWFGFKGGLSSFIPGFKFKTVLATSDAPVINAAVYSGRYVAIHLSKPVEYKDGGTGGWSISSDAGAVSMTYYSGSGGNILYFYTDRIMSSTETATVSYTQPGSGWVDFSNNELATDSSTPVVFS